MVNVIEKVRFVIKSNKYFYNAIIDGLTDDISEATMFHTNDDACYIANELNIRNKIKHTAHKVVVNYLITKR